MTIFFRFFQFRRGQQMMRSFVKAENHFSKKISTVKLFFSSLASRCGVGNIIGVGSAVLIGGPGAIPWMILIGIFCMAISFTECTLAQIFHEPDPNNRKVYRGGTSYSILHGLGKP